MSDPRISGSSVQAGISWESHDTDVCLIWNTFDASTATVDVIVYFHGFAVAHGPDAPLSEFVKVSSFASPERGIAQVRQTPTVAIIPRGVPVATHDTADPWPYRLYVVNQG